MSKNLDVQTQGAKSEKEADARIRIVRAATEMFFQYGIKSVSMDDVAHQLSMSKRTIYDIFSDKEDLVIACLENSMQDLSEKEEYLRKGGATVLQLALETYRVILNYRFSPKFLIDLQKYPRAIDLLERRRKEQLRQYMTFFRKGITEGVFRDDINYALIVQIMRRHMESLPPIDLVEKFSMREIHTTMFIVILRGMSTVKGNEIIDRYVTNGNFLIQ